MAPNIFHKRIEEAIPALLSLAREMVLNKLSNNCTFILAEIENANYANSFERRKVRKRKNDVKIPVSLENALPALNNLYGNLYDINFHIYKATRKNTIIEISYFFKSSLGADYQIEVANHPPMIHCKVAMPPWLSDKEEKFNINWEHQELLTRMRSLWQILKFSAGIRHN